MRGRDVHVWLGVCDDDVAPRTGWVRQGWEEEDGEEEGGEVICLSAGQVSVDIACGEMCVTNSDRFNMANHVHEWEEATFETTLQFW